MRSDEVRRQGRRTVRRLDSCRDPRCLPSATAIHRKSTRCAIRGRPRLGNPRACRRTEAARASVDGEYSTRLPPRGSLDFPFPGSATLVLLSRLCVGRGHRVPYLAPGSSGGPTLFARQHFCTGREGRGRRPFASDRLQHLRGPSTYRSQLMRI